MKLYATVTSERATKGQGGKQLDIEIQNEQQRITHKINVRLLDGNVVSVIVLTDKNLGQSECAPHQVTLDNRCAEHSNGACYFTCPWRPFNKQ